MSDPTVQDLSDRLVEAETRLAYHERMAEDLSDVLTKQARVIERLSLRLAALEERIGDIEQGFGPSPQDDKPPPHY